MAATDSPMRATNDRRVPSIGTTRGRTRMTRGNQPRPQTIEALSRRGGPRFGQAAKYVVARFWPLLLSFREDRPSLRTRGSSFA